MLAAEWDPFVIPIVGTGFGEVDDRVIPIVMYRHDASSGGQRDTTLMGQCTVLAFVSVQHTTAPTPVAVVGIASLELVQVCIGLDLLGGR
jgi:hypothetical protein